MKGNGKRRSRIRTDNGVEVIDLRDPRAMLAANDRMNERYGDGHVAYFDERRGMKVHRHIVAHGNDLLAINDAIRALPKSKQGDVLLHYAMKPMTDDIVHHWSTTVHEA